MEGETVGKQSLSELIQGSITRSGSKCVMGSVLKKLSEADRTDLDQAMANPEIPGSAIKKALNLRGFDVGNSSVYRHRRGDCACGTR